MRCALLPAAVAEMMALDGDDAWARRELALVGGVGDDVQPTDERDAHAVRLGRGPREVGEPDSASDRVAESVVLRRLVDEQLRRRSGISSERGAALVENVAPVGTTVPLICCAAIRKLLVRPRNEAS